MGTLVSLWLMTIECGWTLYLNQGHTCYAPNNHHVCCDFLNFPKWNKWQSRVTMFFPFKFFIFLANYLLSLRIKFVGGAPISLSLEHFHFPVKPWMRHLSARIHIRVFPPAAKFCDNELKQISKKHLITSWKVFFPLSLLFTIIKKIFINIYVQINWEKTLFQLRNWKVHVHKYVITSWKHS